MSIFICCFPVPSELLSTLTMVCHSYVSMWKYSVHPIAVAMGFLIYFPRYDAEFELVLGFLGLQTYFSVTKSV